MKFHKAKKVVIVTEEIIMDKIIKMITESGADGYTVQSVTGKGRRVVRSGNEITSGLFKNVRIETITTSEGIAQKIVVEVLERFFKYYSGIVYMEDVEIIRTK